VCHVEVAVLGDQAPHEARADPGRPRAELAAGGAPPVVDEHLGYAAARPAALRRAQPEVPVLAALDEARVVAADVLPDLPPVERGDVDGAAGEQVRHREAARAPHAVVAAHESDPGVDDAE